MYKPRKKGLDLMTKRSLSGWLFVLPFLLGFLFFVLSPLYTSFMLSIYSQGTAQSTELLPQYEYVNPAKPSEKCYVLELDENGQPKTDAQGNKIYVLQTADKDEDGEPDRLIANPEYWVLKLNNAGEKTYDASGNVIYEMENGQRKVVTSIETRDTLNYVGLDNYKTVCTEKRDYITAVQNTLPRLIYIPAILVFSFLIANVLNSKFRGRVVARVIFFMPVVTATGVASRIKEGSWEVARFGSSVSGAMSGTGLDMVESIKNILSEIEFMSPFVDFVTGAFSELSNIVLFSGVQILIFLAALQTISPSLFEASDMEGATKWEAFWKITFPMVSPMILVATMYTMIDVFTGSNNPMISYLFSSASNSSISLSERMAMGWLYFIVSALLIVIVAVIISRFVYNENEVVKKSRR